VPHFDTSISAALVASSVLYCAIAFYKSNPFIQLNALGHIFIDNNVETTGAIVSYRPRNISPHFCMLFLKLPLFVVMLPTSHTRTVVESVVRATMKVNGRGGNLTPRHPKTP